MCRHGWLFIYHGVHNMAASTPTGFKLCYSAGAMALSREHPNKIIYRSQEPILAPEGPPECHRTVDDVVFPSGIDRRDDLGAPERFDMYYGMADHRIGVARIEAPATLPRSEQMLGPRN
jgi:beta-1,2-mannobiose phosphorylase / 1,2-beta-oligomannan phosphorylase